MQKQRGRGRRLKEKRPLVVTSKQVMAGAFNLHAAASPGPGGFRNSYIQAIAEYPGGAEALRLWCNMVAAGNMQAASVRLWTAAMLRPFFEADGVSIRPVICGEALFKFAMAVCFSACSSGGQQGPWPGPVWLADAGRSRPDGCTGLRSSRWRAALDACPRLAGVMQHLFGAGPTRMWAEKEAGRL